MNKWVSIQSLLAQEEDRQAKETTKEIQEENTNVLSNQNSDVIKEDQTTISQADIRLVSNTSLTPNTSLVPDTRLVSKDTHAYSDTSLVLETSLTPDTRHIEKKQDQTEVNFWKGIPNVKGHTKFYNQIIDYLYSFLDPYEQAIYTQLFRLSWGYGKDKCNIGLPRLAQRANMSVTATQQALKRLSIKGLVNRTGWTLGRGKDQGSEYCIPLPLSLVLDTRLTDNTSLMPNTRLTDNTTIKDDDHDDLKRQDHHQIRNVQVANLSEHEKAVMMMYQKITDNPWTKADSDAYIKVKTVPVEKIEVALRLASERAKNRPNSFAFFIKEILSVSSPKKQSRSQQKKAMEKIMIDIRNSKVGSSNYTISDFAYDVKETCIREDVTFDNNIFDELLEKKKG